MKAAYTTLLGFILLAVTLHAQPRVAYMIPDIGAPGMNTYVEIIAPVDASGTFGGNGLFMNVGDGSETVSVQPDNPADANRIMVGPLVVSWDARLISTQIFVKPGAANGVVPLRITVNGASTVINEFEIVTPQTLGTGGTITGGGILGQGGYGVRSKRGAMIVDRLILDGGTWRASTQDPDPSTPGNQAYLPFILISKGTLALINNATLSVDGATLDAGPGGGGGGGYFCDQTLTDGGPGSDGGKGFTSGGAGGHNSPNRYNSLADGTGANGTSLNNVAPGGYDGCTRYEGAAGGTGHPFGLSAAAACLPTSGGFGSGTTGDQTNGGGGGGYRQNGTAGSGAPDNFGRQHGNLQGVPVAGGAGGGSGNPQASFVSGGCAGAGGGGGGAAVLYSMEVFNNNFISAKGGNGGNRSGSGSGAGGGAGSGGFIEIGAKVPTSSGGSGDISGGAGGTSGGGAGGAGRSRYDGYTGVQPTFTGQSDPYIGPTIDTLTHVQSPSFVLSGTGNGTDLLRVYMRDETGPWRQTIADPTFTGRTWTLPVTVTGGAGRYYFVALQVVNSPSTAPYLNEPSWVFSQAAANMVQVDLIPKINVNRNAIDFGDVSCETALYDTLKIWNSGDAPLDITPSITGDFSILPPFNTAFTIAPGLTPPADTVRMVIRFAPTAVGTRNGTLTLANNDPRAGKNPTVIQLTGRKLNIQSSLTPRIIDFGDICLDSTATDSVEIRVDGDLDGELLAITHLGSDPSPFVIISPSSASIPLPLNAGEPVSIVVQFRPTAPGAFIDSFRVQLDPCDTSYVFVVRGRAVNTSVQVTPNPINFGGVVIGDPSPTISVTIENTGSDPGTITDVFIRPAGAPFTAPAGLVGTVVNPGAANAVTGNVTFTPTDVGPASAELVVVFGALCPDSAAVTLQGNGIRCAQPVPTPLETDFGRVLLGASALDTVELENRTADPMEITEISVPAPFAIVAPVVPPGLMIPPGETIKVIISFTPADTSEVFDSIIVRLNAPCVDSMRIPVTGRGRCARVESGATLVDFGATLVNGTESRSVTLTNNSSQPMDVTALEVDAPWSVVSPVPPQTIPPNGSIVVVVSFTPTDTTSYTGRLIIRQSTPCPDSLAIDLTGRGQCAVLSEDLETLDFGRVMVGATQDLVVTLTNNSTVPMDVTNISLPAPWTIVSPSPNPPLTIPAQGSIELHVRFTPADSIEYAGRLVIRQSTPCDDSVAIGLFGRGRIIVGGAATIVIPTDLQGSPGDRIAIPIILKDASLLGESEATTLQATVRFNASLLYPLRVRSREEAFGKSTGAAAITTGSIISREVQGDDLLLKFELTNSPVPAAPDTLGFIDAQVALGNALGTPVTFDTLFWTDGEVEVASENGLFTLAGYCEEGGPRLFQSTGSFGIKAAAPNPFNPSTEISFETIVHGGTSLVIYDLYGLPVEVLVNNEPLLPGTYTRTWNARNFPSGIYHAVLTSPTLRSTYRLVLVK